MTAMPRCLLVLVAVCWAVRAMGQASPCDDVSYARDMRVRYPQEINATVADEAARRTAWNARWDAISAQLVAARVVTADGQSVYRLALWRRADIASLDAQIAAAETDFRERNIALTGAPVIARLDPLRPDRAACLLAQSALDTLKHKLDLENQQWVAIDQALLDETARLGVRLAP
jgi:hypothetical protein